MTLIEAIENTKVSSCFVESTNGALCFHYYRHKFYLNDGTTIELDNENEFEKAAKMEYAIKYGINEINYSTLKDLHDKLENGSFDSDVDTFLSVYDPKNNVEKMVSERIKSYMKDNTLTVEELSKISFEDAGFTAFTIKYFLNKYKTENRINVFIYSLSFLVIFLTQHYLMFNNVKESFSFLCMVLLLAMCCVNDINDRGISVNNITKFFIGSALSVLINVYTFSQGHYLSGLIFTVIAYYVFMGLMSHRSKSIRRIIRIFDLEVFK